MVEFIFGQKLPIAFASKSFPEITRSCYITGDRSAICAFGKWTLKNSDRHNKRKRVFSIILHALLQLVKHIAVMRFGAGHMKSPDQLVFHITQI